MQTREKLVGALVSLKTAINDTNREAQRDIYDLAEKKATAQFLAGLNTRHGPQPPAGMPQETPPAAGHRRA
jgi:hypothetical protein